MSAGQPPIFRGVSGNRAVADAQAAWLRWHQPQVADQFAPNERPWYGLFERARVETLAGLHLPGMQANLADLEKLAPDTALPNVLYSSMRRLLAGETLTSLDLSADILPARRRPRWLQKWLSLVPEHPLQEMLLPTLQSSCPYLQNGQLFAEKLQPLIQLLSTTIPEAAESLYWPSQPESSDDETSKELTAQGHTASTTDASQPYRVFSREWDELLDMRRLKGRPVPKAQANIGPTQRAEARRLARRLHQQLLALQTRSWNDEQEQGVLERRRLVAMVATGNRRIFRQEQERLVPQACVTLLLDQSGSMRGLPRELTLQAIDLAVQVLEACGIRTEVLGFGTRVDAGNPLHTSWQAMGSPPNPGRLNALRHVLYKPTNMPWRRCRQWLIQQQPLEDGENIDGEALEWAVSRLLRQPEPRKILVIFSDGTPFDEATASANGRNYLEDHLHQVVACIEAHAVHLAAIGMGQGLTRYYPKALVLKRADQVNEMLFEHLADLLSRP